MGQYYRPIILESLDNLPLNEKIERQVKGISDDSSLIIGFFYSWDYENGNKLMEHSYIGNQFVAAVETQMEPGKPFHKKRLVWAGDYADEEEGCSVNLYDYLFINDDPNEAPNPLAKLKCTTKGTNVRHRYLINHTKKEYVDKRHVPVDHYWTDKNGKKWPIKIHPLPLLANEGNGRGGGDFRGNDPKELIGRWARDVISVENEKPADYTELVFDLTEKD